MAAEPPGRAVGCAKVPISRSASIAWIATSLPLREQGRLLAYERCFTVGVEFFFSSAMFARGKRKHMKWRDRMDVPLQKARVATSYSSGRSLPSIVGTERLNFYVRDGNGCFPSAGSRE